METTVADTTTVIKGLKWVEVGRDQYEHEDGNLAVLTISWNGCLHPEMDWDGTIFVGDEIIYCRQFDSFLAAAFDLAEYINTREYLSQV